MGRLGSGVWGRRVNTPTGHATAAPCDRLSRDFAGARRARAQSSRPPAPLPPGRGCTAGSRRVSPPPRRGIYREGAGMVRYVAGVLAAGLCGCALVHPATPVEVTVTSAETGRPVPDL